MGLPNQQGIFTSYLNKENKPLKLVLCIVIKEAEDLLHIFGLVIIIFHIWTEDTKFVLGDFRGYIHFRDKSQNTGRHEDNPSSHSILSQAPRDNVEERYIVLCTMYISTLYRCTKSIVHVITILTH